MLVLMLLPMLFIGCTQIPFDKFILDNNEIKEEGVNVDFKYIDTNNIVINNNSVNTITTNVEKLLNETIKHDNYIKYYKKDSFLENVKELFEDVLKKDNNDKISKLGKNIYLLEDNYEYYGFSLININYNAEDGISSEINIYAITDSKDFLLNVIKVNFTDDYLIKNIEIVSENNIVQNTEKSLDEYSLLNETTLEEMNEIKNTFNALKNTNLFEKLDYKEIDSFIENNIEAESYDLKTLEKIFTVSSGKLDNYYLINYEINDIKCRALSYFTFRFVNENDEKVDVKLTYSRAENKITEILKI